MPYERLSELPEGVRGLPNHAQEIWRAAFNAAFGEYDGDEERAFKVAWAAVKRGYEQGEDGKWHAKKSVEEDGDVEVDARAVWTVAYQNDLPDSSFLYIEDGGEKDEGGKTTPRSLRHFPYKDAAGKVDVPHLRNAIARIPQSNAPGLDEAKKAALQEKARGILEEETGNAEEKGEPGIVSKALHAIGDALRSVFGCKEPAPPPEPGRLFIVRDKATGRRRWLGVVTNNYYPDREGEGFALTALQKAVARMMDSGTPLTSEKGPSFRFPDRRVVLDVGHIELPATKDIRLPLAVGTADMVGLAGPFVTATGLEDDTPIGKAFFDYAEAHPEADLRMSHLFEYDAAQKSADGVYLDGVELVRFSALPAGTAANPWTAFLVMDAKTKNGGDGMAVQFDEKMRPLLVGAFGEETVSGWEKQLAAADEKAVAGGVGKKGETETPISEPAPPAPGTEKTPEKDPAVGALEARIVALEAALAAEKSARESQLPSGFTTPLAEPRPAVAAGGKSTLSEAGVPMHSPLRKN